MTTDPRDATIARLTKQMRSLEELARSDQNVIARLTADLEAARAQIGAVLAEAAGVVDACNAEGPYQAIGAASRILALSPDASAALERALRAERNKTRREDAEAATFTAGLFSDTNSHHAGKCIASAILAALEGEP